MACFFALVLLTRALFAGEVAGEVAGKVAVEEVIAECASDRRSVTLESGRVLSFADDPRVNQVLDQMQEGDRLHVEGSGVVVVSHKSSALRLFADESAFEGEPIESITLYTLPKAGSCGIKTLLSLNLPKTAIVPLPVKPLSEALRGLGSLNQALDRLQTEGVVEQAIGEATLALVALRSPRAYLESLYHCSALPFKEDPARGFDLFLNGEGRLPYFMQETDPLTHERCSSPLRMRQLLLLEALFVERSATKSLVIDFDKWCEDPARLIARMCAEYGPAHAPYFKEPSTQRLCRPDSCRPAKSLELSVAQERQLNVKLDRKLEQHFGFEL